MRAMRKLGGAWVLALLTAVAPVAWRAAPQAGRVEARTIQDTVYGIARRVWVYTPSAYSASGPAYPVAFFFDGDDYLRDLQLPATLDRLIAEKRIPPMVAVLVDNSVDRLGDLANHARFARFMGDELVPWARTGWHISADPHRTIVAGYSAGGLGACYAALRRPEIFGNVLSQSGAVWRGDEGSSSSFEYLKGQFASAPKQDLRFYMEVGEGETHHVLGTGPVFIEATRRLREVLVAKGYAVTYVEVPGAVHEPGHWRAQLPFGLAALAGGW
jgi:enterochelin esterase family protein